MKMVKFFWKYEQQGTVCCIDSLYYLCCVGNKTMNSRVMSIKAYQDRLFVFPSGFL